MIILNASDGMIYTNNKIYGKQIFLADGMDESTFYEITEAEYHEIKEGNVEGDGSGYYDNFWDNYQKNGTRTSYQNAFCREGWNDNNFTPKYNMRPTTCSQMFQGCNITDVEKALNYRGIILDTSNSTTFLQYTQSSTITVLPKTDISKATNTSYAFAVSSLKNIRELVVSETTPFSNTFTNASGLEEIIVSGTIGQDFDIHWSTKLSKDSIISIFNTLSATTEGLKVTFSGTAIMSAFNVDDIASSEEFLALVNDHPNWSILTTL